MNTKMSIKIEELKKLPVTELARKFKCLPEEVCMGDYIARYTDDKVCPYKVIMGFANFEGSDVRSLGELQVVYGKLLEDRGGALTDVNGNPSYMGINLADSKITSLGKLEKVYGSITLNENIISLGKLQYLGSNLFLGGTKLQNLGDLEVVEGILNFERTTISTLGKLKKVGVLRIGNQSLKSFGNLEKADEIIIATQPKYRYEKMIEDNFYQYGRKCVRIFQDVNEYEY